MQTGAQGDEPAVEFLEQLFIDARLIIKPFHVAERDELTQITVALLIHRQEDKMVIVFLRPLIDAFFFEAAGGRDVNLASDDRLHAVAHRFPIEFDGAEHVPMIGHGNGRLF